MASSAAASSLFVAIIMNLVTRLVIMIMMVMKQASLFNIFFFILPELLYIIDSTLIPIDENDFLISFIHMCVGILFLGEWKRKARN